MEIHNPAYGRQKISWSVPIVSNGQGSVGFPVLQKICSKIKSNIRETLNLLTDAIGAPLKKNHF